MSTHRVCFTVALVAAFFLFERCAAASDSSVHMGEGFFEHYRLDVEKVNILLEAAPAPGENRRGMLDIPLYTKHIPPWVLTAEKSFVITAVRGGGKTTILQKIQEQVKSADTVTLQVSRTNLETAIRSVVQRFRGDSLRNDYDIIEQEWREKDMLDFVILELLEALFGANENQMARLRTLSPFYKHRLVALAVIYSLPGSVAKLEAFFEGLFREELKRSLFGTRALPTQCPSIPAKSLLGNSQPNPLIEETRQFKRKVRILPDDAYAEELRIACAVLDWQKIRLSGLFGEGGKQTQEDLSNDWFVDLLGVLEKAELNQWVAFDGLDEVDALWGVARQCREGPWTAVIRSLSPLLRRAGEFSVFRLALFAPTCATVDVSQVIKWRTDRVQHMTLSWTKQESIALWGYANFTVKLIGKQTVRRSILSHIFSRTPTFPSFVELVGGRKCAQQIIDKARHPRGFNIIMQRLLSVFTVHEIPEAPEGDCSYVEAALTDAEDALNGVVNPPSPSSEGQKERGSPFVPDL